MKVVALLCLWGIGVSVITPCWGAVLSVTTATTGSVLDLSATNSNVQVGTITVSFSSTDHVTVTLQDTSPNPGRFVRLGAASPLTGDLAPFTVTVTDSGQGSLKKMTASPMPLTCDLSLGPCAWAYQADSHNGSANDRVYQYAVSTTANPSLFRGTYAHTVTITISDP